MSGHNQRRDLRRRIKHLQLWAREDRKPRANNLQNYDEKGRAKKRGKHRLNWKNSQGYLATKRRLAQQERKLAAHRKSLHGRLVHEIVRVDNDIHIEKISYKSWQKRGPACPRDAHRPLETHGCKYRRHPTRVFHVNNQAVAVLSQL